MNIKKLKELEESFFEYYPNGFEDDKLLPIIKRFNSSKFHEETKELFKKENFSQPEIICDNFSKIILYTYYPVTQISIELLKTLNYNVSKISLIAALITDKLFVKLLLWTSNLTFCLICIVQILSTLGLATYLNTQANLLEDCLSDNLSSLCSGF